MGLKPRTRTGLDAGVVERVRAALGPRPDVVEKRMFGGLAFMVRGHMTVGVNGDVLMIRTGAEGMGDALAQPHARPMDFTGKPLRGFVYVDPPGFATAGALAGWVQRALDFTGSLPAK